MAILLGLKRSTVTATLFALLLCCLQLGGYSVLSMSFVLFVIAVFVIGPRRYVAVVPAVALAFILMLGGYAWYINDEDVASALLRTIRELVVLSTMLAACKFPIRWSQRLEITAKKTLIIWVALCVSLALVQFLMLELRGTGPFLPWQLYGATGGVGEGNTTVPSYWLQFASQHGLEVGREVRIRPVAFYSEPSYLGFMLTAAYFCYAKIELGVRKRMFCFGVCMAGALLAKTAAGVFSLAAVFIFLNYRNFRLRQMRPYLIIGFVASLVVVAAFSDRIYGAFDASDASSYSRMVMPFLALVEAISSWRLFGIPSFYVPSFLGFNIDVDVTGSYGADNGLVNLLIYYGFGGLVIISILLRAMRNNWILFVLCALFNGSVLHFDKGFIISVVLLIVLSKASSQPTDVKQGIQ